VRDPVRPFRDHRGSVRHLQRREAAIALNDDGLRVFNDTDQRFDRAIAVFCDVAGEVIDVFVLDQLGDEVTLFEERAGRWDAVVQGIELEGRGGARLLFPRGEVIIRYPSTGRGARLSVEANRRPAFAVVTVGGVPASCRSGKPRRRSSLG